MRTAVSQGVPGVHISAPTVKGLHTHSYSAHPGTSVVPDGICHCDPQPDSDAIGECPRCHHLDLRKSFA